MKKIMLSFVLGFILIGMTGFVLAEDNCTLREEKCCVGENCSEIIEVVCAPGYEQVVQSCDEFCNPIAPCVDNSGTPYEDDGCTEYFQCSNGKRIKKCELKDEVCVCRAISSSECSETDDDEDDETDDDNETDKNETNNNRKLNGIGQTIRNRVKAGVYTSPEGQQIRVRELAQNRIEFFNGNYTVQSELNLTEEQDQNQTKFKVKLNNGRNAEIKIMPDIASIKALERLRLKRCNDTSINCSIELKEVGEGNQTRLVYEAKAQKTFRLFGIFKNSEEVTTQIDAETGEEIETRRPWWSFLASEDDEAEEVEV